MFTLGLDYGYDRIIIELNLEWVSRQLSTVSDYNWMIITSNNLKEVVWCNYRAWLNKMGNTRWHEETKQLIALGIEGAGKKQV